jgi:hypothetical protein
LRARSGDSAAQLPMRGLRQPPARARASAMGGAVSERGTGERRAESSGERIHAAGGSSDQAEHTTVLSTQNRT